MTNLLEYFNDGANAQAKAVLCYLQYKLGSGIEESWNEKRSRYDAEIKIARWENCREQGYIASLTSNYYKRQLNIAFFEHRNSDSICAVKWEQKSINTITIDTAKFGDVYKDKWDISYDVGYGKVKEMAEWILEQFIEFWAETSKKVEKDLEIK